MDRRAFVTGSVAALSVAVAGCTAATGSRRLSLAPFDPTHVAYAVDDLAADRRAALETIREEGAEVTYGFRRFGQPGDKGYVELDGEFYRITTDETGERVLMRDFLFAEIDTSEEAAANAVAPEHVYGEADRRRIARAVEGDREVDPYIFRDVPSDETDLRYEPEHEFVELEPDRPWSRKRVFHLRVVSGELVETEYTTVIEPVAGTGAELARHLDDEGFVQRVDEGELTAAQRTALESAVDDGAYTERRPFLGDDEPFDGLPLAPKRDPETDRPYRLVRYDGERYVWDVDYVGGDG